MKPATLSIVVPARNESAAIRATLARLREPGVLEVIVVDGGSADDTLAVAARGADRVIASPPGRARQMNAGAAAARGEVLLFLHADTLAPPGFAAAIAGALDDPAAVGGRFDLRLDASGAAFRLLEAAINSRTRLTGIFTGDHGLFVRRDIFDRLGGFPDMPILEDLEMAIALRRLGRVVALRERVTTSARRWQRKGIVATVLRMWGIRAAYFLGASPEWLATIYREVR